MIPPLHVKIHPTNNCDLNCSFCSFSRRDKSAELEFGVVEGFLHLVKGLGCEAVTITGGGEPLLYPKINDVVSLASRLGIRVGIITNGKRLSNLNCWSKVDWCRISFSDEREYDGKAVCDCDVGYLYVVTETPNWVNLQRVINAVTESSRILYLVITPDINCTITVDKILRNVTGLNEKIFFAKEGTGVGVKECLVSLLKPNLAPDAYIYPCSNVHKVNSGWPGEMRMCHASDFRKAYLSQRAFDGSECKSCPYEPYNTYLQHKITTYNHGQFY